MRRLGSAVELLDTTRCDLVGFARASQVAPLGARRFLHAGPPIEIENLPGAMKGALCGALVFEREAADLEQAARIVDAGEVELAPCHSVGGVGAMAGIVSSSMPVCVLQSSVGATVFSPLNEGLGKALRFGTTDAATLERLAWMREVAMLVLDRGVRAAKRVDLTEVQQEGLRRGDECHNRNVASSAALLLKLVPSVVSANPDPSLTAKVLEWASGNPHFFLPFSMAAGKAVALSAMNFEGDPTVTAMAGNGVEFGIQVSGLGDRWFCGPSPLSGVKCFEGYTVSDGQAAMGDSFITEAIGLGAFSLSAAPAIGSFLGTDTKTGHAVVEEMRTICGATSTRFHNPFEDFVGAPIGIDIRKVVNSRIAPMVNNGVAHRQAGIGQIGAGLTRLPLEPFDKALAALDGQE